MEQSSNQIWKRQKRGYKGVIYMITIDMEYPKHCTECRFDMPDGSCCAMPMNFCGHTAYSELEERPVWCPLIPIVETHYKDG